MTKVSANELKIAAGMVVWFSRGGGESDIENLADSFGLDQDDLYAWAIAQRFMFRGEDYTSLAMLPGIWEAFAATSRICLALHTALQQLKGTDRRVAVWVAECEHELATYAEHHKAHRARHTIRGWGDDDIQVL